MKTVTTVTDRKAIIRPMFVSRVVKPPLAVGHRKWLDLGDAVPARATHEPSRNLRSVSALRVGIAIATRA
jgi:hypothetical protein